MKEMKLPLLNCKASDVVLIVLSMLPANIPIRLVCHRTLRRSFVS